MLTAGEHEEVPAAQAVDVPVQSTPGSVNRERTAAHDTGRHQVTESSRRGPPADGPLSPALPAPPVARAAGSPDRSVRCLLVVQWPRVRRRHGRARRTHLAGHQHRFGHLARAAAHHAARRHRRERSARRNT
ncbi:hypothetical protein GCM10029964_122780 [Kibdelosporangium lantanae]